MSSLQKIQRDFSAHIFKKSQLQILQSTIHSEVEALERLNVYRNNVLGNFESILSKIFFVTKKILGEKKFNDLVQKYCQKFPSKSGDLNDFGAHFPRFLKSLKPSYLQDLARLELLYHQAYFIASADQKVDLKKFKKIETKDLAKLILTLDPSCTLFASDFAVFSIWKKEQKITNPLKPEFMLIHSNKIILLKQEEFNFLSLVQKRQPLYKIYQSLCRKHQSHVDIGVLVNNFIANGAIVKFDL